MVSWLADHPYGPGDLASIAGLGVALVGFLITISGLAKTRSAAMEAAIAATAAHRRLRFVATVVDLTMLLSELEMVKRQHRLRDWRQCLNIYPQLRRKLIQVRASNPFSSERERSAVQAFIRTLYEIEGIVEQLVVSEADLPPSRMNALLSRQIDGIVEILVRISQPRQGGP